MFFSEWKSEEGDVLLRFIISTTEKKTLLTAKGKVVMSNSLHCDKVQCEVVRPYGPGME